MTDSAPGRPELRGGKLPPSVRRRVVLEYIRANGSATVEQLAREQRVSPVTIQRDLSILEEEGTIRRVPGGATCDDQRPVAFPTAWQERLRTRSVPKMQIALTAHNMLEPDSTVFLDGSTSAFALAAVIESDPLPLTVVTVSPLIASALRGRHIHIVIAPGQLDPELRTVGGGWTEEFLGGLNFSTAFVSGAGLSLRHGLTTTRREVAAVTRQAMRQAGQTVCLVDSTKIGRSALLTIAPVDQFSAIVTDHELAPHARAALAAADASLISAGRDLAGRAEHILQTSHLWSTATATGSGSGAVLRGTPPITPLSTPGPHP